MPNFDDKFAARKSGNSVRLWRNIKVCNMHFLY